MDFSRTIPLVVSSDIGEVRWVIVWFRNTVENLCVQYTTVRALSGTRYVRLVCDRSARLKDLGSRIAQASALPMIMRSEKGSSGIDNRWSYFQSQPSPTLAKAAINTISWKKNLSQKERMGTVNRFCHHSRCDGGWRKREDCIFPKFFTSFQRLFSDLNSPWAMLSLILFNRD